MTVVIWIIDDSVATMLSGGLIGVFKFTELCCHVVHAIKWGVNDDDDDDDDDDMQSLMNARHNTQQ